MKLCSIFLHILDVNGSSEFFARRFGFCEGGVSIPSQSIELGLVDECHFVVQPIVVGEGRRLDSISLPEKLNLKLAESKIFNSGFVALRYLKQ